MSKTRILIDARLGTSITSGMGHYTRELVSRLVNYIDQFEISVLAPPEVQFFGLKQIPTRFTPRSLQGHLEAWRLCRALKPDLVHFLHPYIPPLTRPFLVTVHDLIPLHYATLTASTRGGFSHIIERSVRKAEFAWLKNHARGLITVSQATQRDLACEGVEPEKITVIPLASGADQNLISPAGDSSDQPPRPFFLHVGALTPHKNVEVLLDLLKKIDLFTLVHCGPKDFFSQRFAIAVQDAQLEGRYWDLGPVSESRLSELSSQCQALIAPSLMEGFGLPVAQALARGVPVIVSSCGSLPEVATCKAYYVSPFDKLAWREIIITFLQAANRKPVAAIQRTWDQVVRESVEFYAHLTSHY